MSEEYKPITIEDIRAAMDHLSKLAIPPPEPIYFTREEWEALCVHVKPIQMNDPIAFRGHPIRIVTAEERETILKLKQLSDEAPQRQI